MRKYFLSRTFFSAEKILAIGALTILLAIAFFIRSWHIGTLPAGLYPDEAMNGVDALHAIETGDYQLFYPNNNGREGLFINLQALTVHAFGAIIPALRIWSAIFGTLAILGVYLLAKELWHKRGVALIAAFFMTFSYWAINFSHIGFRAIMLPFILSFAFFFFFQGLRTKKLLSFAASGVVFGLGLHTYIAFRVAPLILILLTLGCMASYREFLKHFWKQAVVFIVFMFLAASPMLFDFVRHPDHFASRSSSISVFSPDVNHGNLPLTLAKTIVLSLIQGRLEGRKERMREQLERVRRP